MVVMSVNWSEMERLEQSFDSIWLNHNVRDSFVYFFILKSLLFLFLYIEDESFVIKFDCDILFQNCSPYQRTFEVLCVHCCSEHSTKTHRLCPQFIYAGSLQLFETFYLKKSRADIPL